MNLRWLSLLGIAGTPAFAAGPGGDVHDRLDATGSMTDRYLSPEEVRAVLHAHNDAFFQCFRANLRGGVDPGETGVTFVIGRDGKAVSIVLDSAHGPPALGSCVQTALSAIPFPDHDGEPMEVAYPLVWQVDREGARLLLYPIVFTRARPVRIPLVLLPPDVSDETVRAVTTAVTGLPVALAPVAPASAVAAPPPPPTPGP